MLGSCERTVSCRRSATSPAATASARRSCRGRHCRLGLGPSCAGSRPQPCRVHVAPGQYAGAGRRPVPPAHRGGLRPRDPWVANGEKMVAGATQMREQDGALPLTGRLPDLTGAVFHGFPIRGMDLPAVTTSFLRRRPGRQDRGPLRHARLWSRRCASDGAPSGPGRPVPWPLRPALRPGMRHPAQVGRAAGEGPVPLRHADEQQGAGRLTLSRHFGVPWSGSPAPRGSQPCQPAGFSQAGAAIPSGRSEGDRRGGLTVKRPVDRRP